MTAHELARKLLEGPDVLVFRDQGTGYAEWEPEEITLIEPATLWQYSSLGVWSECLLDHEPKCAGKRSLQALRLR